METINLLLRVSSALIAFVLIHQLFFSKEGVRRHRILGRFAMYIGALIVALVTVRGLHQENSSLMYAGHLAAGFPFFLTFFRTGYLGYKAKTDKNFVGKHKRSAWLTSLLLLATLVFGVVSFLSR